MPTIKSSKKRMKLSAAARLKNRSTRAHIRTAIKHVHGSAGCTLANRLTENPKTKGHW